MQSISRPMRPRQLAFKISRGLVDAGSRTFNDLGDLRHLSVRFGGRLRAVSEKRLRRGHRLGFGIDGKRRGRGEQHEAKPTRIDHRSLGLFNLFAVLLACRSASVAPKGWALPSVPAPLRPL